MPQLVLTDSDNGTTVTVQAGDLVIVRISENPTTGYVWAIEPAASQLLVLQSSDYLPATTEPIAGSGGERSFTFQAVQSGITEIQLKLWRVWVGDSSVVQRYAVTIHVQA